MCGGAWVNEIQTVFKNEPIVFVMITIITLKRVLEREELT